MLTLILAATITLFLAWANGANDNFKGVATLLGSGTASFSNARIWATVTTAAGSLAAVILAEELLKKFTGKGLVPDEVITMKSFCLAVIFAAGATVMLATRFGFPISTTHALTGGLVGAGWLASEGNVNFSQLGGAFFAPLIVSPVLSLVLAALVYPLLRLTRSGMKVKKETCVCVGQQVVSVVAPGVSAERAIAMYTELAPVSLTVGTTVTCQEKYQGRVMGVSALSLVDNMHYLSAGAVGFARGLNDTPKIAALLLAASAFSPAAAISAVAIFIAIGGWVSGRKVADTMSYEVTAMNAGQGFSANLVTSFVVIFASRFGMPVSTTHVSCGALFGIGSVTGQAKWKTILGILTAWVTTLPVSAFLGAAAFSVFSRLI